MDTSPKKPIATNISPVHAPLVSIHMLTYNRAQYITEAISSVHKQTYQNWELLIINDGSTDNTESLIKSFADVRIRYYKNEKNIGVVKNRNKALSLSQGTYVAILDSDDIWIDADKLEKQVAFMEQYPRTAIVGTHIYIINATGSVIGKEIYPIHLKNIQNTLPYKNTFAHSSMLLRTDAMRECGGYSESAAPQEDYDLTLSIAKKYDVSNLDKIATSYRIHTGNISTKQQLQRARGVLAVLQKHRHDYPAAWKGIARMRLKILLLVIFGEQLFMYTNALKKYYRLKT